MKQAYKTGLIALALLGGIGNIAAEETATETGSTILGFLGYSNTDPEKPYKNGWYSINNQGDCTLMWTDQKIGVTGTYFSTGWVRNNAVCGIFGNSSRLYYLEFDLNTGENTVEKEINQVGENDYKYMRTGAYNPTDDYVYGFSYNGDMTKDYFIKAPAGDFEKCEIVRDMPNDFGVCKSVCYNPTDNHFYGIDIWNYLVRFDIYGNFELLTEIKMPIEFDFGGFSSGMCYSIKDDCFFWNARTTTYDSYFVRIDPKTYECTIVREFDYLDHFSFLVCLDTDGEQDGPAAPAMTSYDFAGSSLDGKITYTMPTTLGNGAAAPAEMTWTATVLPSGAVQTGTAAPGESITVDFTKVNQGENTFSMYAQAGDKRGSSVFTNSWVGFDAPYVPRKVRLTELTGEKGKFEVTWEPVTKSAHGGFINLENMVYGIFLNGEQVTTTAECKAILNFDADSPNKEYTAMVVAVCDGLQSEAGVSNMVTAGKGYELPFSLIPTKTEAAKMIIINVDGDRSGWRLRDNMGEPAFFTSKDYDNPGNDWLITPKLVFPSKDIEYTVSFEAAVHAINFNEEYFEIWLGETPTPEGMTMQNIAPRTQVMLYSYEPFEYKFRVPEAGSYYVGVRSVSAADQQGWYLRQMLVDGASGVDFASDNLGSVTGAKGCIVVSSLAGEEVTVITTDGRTAAAKTISSEYETIDVAPGIYVVKSGDRVWKTIVK